MTLWHHLPPPDSLLKETAPHAWRQTSLHLPLLLHVMLIKRLFAWRFNTAVNNSALECLPTCDKGALWGRCAIPGGVPFRSAPFLPLLLQPSSSRPHHMCLIATSSQKPLWLKPLFVSSATSADNQKPAWIYAKTHVLQQTVAAWGSAFQRETLGICYFITTYKFEIKNSIVSQVHNTSAAFKWCWRNGQNVKSVI